MTIYLTINDEQLEGKGSFKAVYHAKDHYSTKDEKGNEQVDGIAVIYEGLLNKDPVALVQLWDCILSNHKKKPSKETIENALAEASNDGEDFDPLFKDGVQVLEESGFFKQKVDQMWKQLDMVKGSIEEDQKEAVEAEIKRLTQARKELSRQKKS